MPPASWGTSTAGTQAAPQATQVVLERTMARAGAADAIGRGATLADSDWVRAIRHGVRRDGTSLIVMPSEVYVHLGERDLAALVATLPALRLVAFNGQTAARIGTRSLPPGTPRVTLPSSSPAYTLPFAAKALAWREIARHLSP